ncbi:MAG TPA: HAMP domain-containing sensor histidine kinase [Chitinophagaceae bacterium]|nr:HAMP domain-containing sensor histidine kinase [Chitinophagaceae bacterium]
MRPQSIKPIFLYGSILAVLIIAVPLLGLTRIYSSGNRINHTDLTLLVIGLGLIVILLATLVTVLVYFYRRQLKQDAQKEFLNNFMHEFKTPLAVMRIAGGVLLSPGIQHQSSRLSRYAGIIKEQSEQLEQKVNRILEVAVSETKETVLEKEEIDVNAMVYRIIGFLQPLVDEKGAVIEFLPETEPLRIHADAMYLQQAVINLLDNSLKYATKPYIKIRTARTERTCIISIKDNGIGIEKKYQKDIFRKFYRIPTGNVHNVKGFGIGLNFAKKVIDAHHGRIEVQSEPGVGSEFSILMPIN